MGKDKAGGGAMTAEQERLVLDNLPLAIHIAKKYKNCGIEWDDLVSLCYLGLAKAARNFDSARGPAFGTFAGACMDREVLMELRNQRRHYSSSREISVETQIGNTEGFTIGSTIPDLADEFELLERRLLLKQLISNTKLTNKQRQVLIYYYACDLRQGHIGNIMGTAQSYVSKLLKDACQKIYKESLK